MDESVKNEIEQLLLQRVLIDAKEEEVKARKELEKIFGLVKEMYRQAGIPVYEPLDPNQNWEGVIQGGG